MARRATARTVTRFVSITSPSSFTVAENASFSVTLTANYSGVKWKITGGPDAARFTLNGSTLGMTAKDFEAPADANSDNIYLVNVVCIDPFGFEAFQTISVRVTDVAGA